MKDRMLEGEVVKKPLPARNSVPQAAVHSGKGVPSVLRVRLLLVSKKSPKMATPKPWPRKIDALVASAVRSFTLVQKIALGPTAILL
jgi:hypothetical protein